MPVGERWLFPTVHKTGQPGKVLTGDAVAAMIQRRAAAAGYTAAQVDLLGGHSLRSGSSPTRSAPAPTPTPSRGRPVPRSEDARGLRPGVLVGNAVLKLDL